MKINYVIGAFLCVLGCYGCSSPKTEVKSPDGHIKMALTVDGRCVKMHTFCFLRTKPRLSQAGALLLPKDFVSLGIRISL